MENLKKVVKGCIQVEPLEYQKYSELQTSLNIF